MLLQSADGLRGGRIGVGVIESTVAGVGRRRNRLSAIC
jgi:hypothetical protein